MSTHLEKMSHYDYLKHILEVEGWIEQKSGESYLNGTVGTNFMKDGQIITLLWNTMPDEEQFENF